MPSKFLYWLFAGIISSTTPFAMTGASAEGVVTCPGPTCSCKEVTVHTCDARPDGTIYNCRDVKETQCTITSGPGSGKAVIRVPEGGTKSHPVKIPPGTLGGRSGVAR
jgi:hypothetical protein